MAPERFEAKGDGPGKAPVDAEWAEERRGFFVHLRYYVVGNFLIYLFYLFAESHGYWPLYILGFWSLFLAGHLWSLVLAWRRRKKLANEGHSDLENSDRER